MYLAHTKTLSPRTLQQPYGQGPTIVLGVRRLLMSEVPLDTEDHARAWSQDGGGGGADNLLVEDNL